MPRLLVIIVIVGVSAGALVVVARARTPAPVPVEVVEATPEPTPPPLIVVDVEGAVVRPGVVKLASGARVADALAAAGGTTPDADPAALNKAATPRDGARVYGPRYGERGTVGAIGSAALALASATGSRRSLWACACASAVGVSVRLLLGPVPGIDFAQLASLDALRADLARPLEVLVPEPESGILLGIVLGERASVSADLAYAFAVSGTTHLLAISGFNMTLVGAAVALALRGRARPTARAVATVAAIVAYSLLVGLGPSVMRAALMSSVASVGLASGRRAATANALCVAVTAMLFADPAAIADLGFLLSATPTAGLILWLAPLASRLAFLRAAIRVTHAPTLAAQV